MSTHPEQAQVEALYLVMAGGDAFQSEIVPASRLDDAYLLTQWGSLDDIDAQERADALAHFHDDDSWTHTEITGKGERVEFSVSFEDGWVKVTRLPDDARAAFMPTLTELKRLACICPELNLSNYTDDDAEELNGWAIEVAREIDRLAALTPQTPAEQPEAKCLMCGGSGWLGGPTFYSPDEGGEPCPDCESQPEAATPEDSSAVRAEPVPAPVQPVAPSYYEGMRLTLIVQLHELIDVAERYARHMHKRGDAEERDLIQGAIDYARKVSDPYNYNGRTPPAALTGKAGK